ncbi:MAG: VOC family protein [Burkholderiaceae bacterium]|nr:VOC family protein [Burkholderiaceae bacterium]
MQTANLSVVEVKAFVPAKDSERSMAFYQALGFTRASADDGIAYFHHGNASFLLQDFYVREHADNFLMHLLVKDVEAWHVMAKAVAQQFEVRIGEPEDQPWAMRDFVLFDPSGVLWRIGQNLPVAA